VRIQDRGGDANDAPVPQRLDDFFHRMALLNAQVIVEKQHVLATLCRPPPEVALIRQVRMIGGHMYNRRRPLELAKHLLDLSRGRLTIHNDQLAGLQGLPRQVGQQPAQ
jgi:hypothetical protein